MFPTFSGGPSAFEAFNIRAAKPVKAQISSDPRLQREAIDRYFVVDIDLFNKPEHGVARRACSSPLRRPVRELMTSKSSTVPVPSFHYVASIPVHRYKHCRLLLSQTLATVLLRSKGRQIFQRSSRRQDFLGDGVGDSSATIDLSV